MFQINEGDKTGYLKLIGISSLEWSRMSDEEKRGTVQNKMQSLYHKKC